MNSDTNLALACSGDSIRNDDEWAEAVGAALAEVLKLKRDPDHRDRWQTTWGSKTSAGLARSVLEILVSARTD